MSQLTETDKTMTAEVVTKPPKKGTQTKPPEVVSGQPLNLLRRLSKVMGEVERLNKSKRNDFAKFDYTPIEDIKDLIRSLLVKNGVMMYPVLTSAEKIDKGWVIQLTFTYVDLETGESLTVPYTSEGSGSGNFSLPVAWAFGVKYHLMHFFMMTTGDDLDPDGGNPTQTNKSRPKQDPDVTTMTHEQLSWVVASYQRLYPDDKRESQTILEGLFDRVCGVGSEFTLTNGYRVMSALTGKALEKIKQEQTSQRLKEVANWAKDKTGQDLQTFIPDPKPDPKPDPDDVGDPDEYRVQV